MTVLVAPIIEGQTEVRCLERLLHRVWNEIVSGTDRLRVLTPFRGKRDQLIKQDGRDLANKLGQLLIKLSDELKRDSTAKSLILILLDAEEDCPAKLAPQLLEVARPCLPPNTPITCVLANRMLENWIVAGSSKLAGVNGLPNTFPTPADYEKVNGAVWLNAQLRSVNRARKYKKTIDSTPFVDTMSLSDCRKNAPSFDKLCREFESLIAH